MDIHIYMYIHGINNRIINQIKCYSGCYASLISPSLLTLMHTEKMGNVCLCCLHFTS